MIPDPELDALVDRVENEDDTEADAYLIVDLLRADKAMDVLRKLDAKKAEMEALYRARLDELDEFRDAHLRRDARVRSFFAARLEDFHRRRLAEDPKAVTIHLTGGTLKSNAGQPTWTYSDEAAFIAWAEREWPDLLRTDPKVDRNAVKAAFRDSVKDGRAVTGHGEMVPGLVVEPAQRTFTPAPKPIGGAA